MDPPQLAKNFWGGDFNSIAPVGYVIQMRSLSLFNCFSKRGIVVDDDGALIQAQKVQTTRRRSLEPSPTSLAITASATLHS
ncbi:hypothetical protein DUNSADRAFT_16488, partial [Dunaliella salina]